MSESFKLKFELCVGHILLNSQTASFPKCGHRGLWPQWVTSLLLAQFAFKFDLNFDDGTWWIWLSHWFVFYTIKFNQRVMKTGRGFSEIISDWDSQWITENTGHYPHRLWSMHPLWLGAFSLNRTGSHWIVLDRSRSHWIVAIVQNRTESLLLLV